MTDGRGLTADNAKAKQPCSTTKITTPKALDEKKSNSPNRFVRSARSWPTVAATPCTHLSSTACGAAYPKWNVTPSPDDYAPDDLPHPAAT